eukprot:scaffold71423_cov62-Phaeocystis_antarctica.AAC.2
MNQTRGVGGAPMAFHFTEGLHVLALAIGIVVPVVPVGAGLALPPRVHSFAVGDARLCPTRRCTGHEVTHNRLERAGDYLGESGRGPGHRPLVVSLRLAYGKHPREMGTSGPGLFDGYGARPLKPVVVRALRLQARRTVKPRPPFGARTPAFTRPPPGAKKVNHAYIGTPSTVLAAACPAKRGRAA